MYMSNRSKYAKYNIDDFPANYSGQYTRESTLNHADEPNLYNANEGNKDSQEPKERKEESRDKEKEHEHEREEKKEEKREESICSPLSPAAAKEKDGTSASLKRILPTVRISESIICQWNRGHKI